MSFSSTTNRTSLFTGTGSNTTFAYSFYIQDDDDIRVVVRNTLGVQTVLTKTTDYTVTGAGAAAGGNVVLVDANQAWLDSSSNGLKLNYKLLVRRKLSHVQTADVRNQGEYYPEYIEDALDRIVMAQQSLQDEVDRCIKIPDTVAASGFTTELSADIENLEDYFLKVNDDGDGVELIDIDEVVSGISNATLEFEVTDGQAATNLTGVTVLSTDYSSAKFEAEIIRGTTVFANVPLAMQYINSTWRVVVGGALSEEAHGVTFSVSGTTTGQLRAALDSGAGNGTIKLKPIYFNA